eukprot:TRINITY_DN2128_c0_g1_i8.p1 TRINITY_DN2128_c0_g1~~TRINITY_DN2128_c0_g1_i8.p1  ORF type:complete len:346 (+),score=39.74 TRINITY_DN2128_c0_g1_i8:1-1038(+)
MKSVGGRVVIVGGGAAGITAAIFARQGGRNVLLLERNGSLGKKILVSGGTRCNVLPRAVRPKADYHTEATFPLLHAILKGWSLEEARRWLTEDIGLQLKLEEDTSKWFPADDSARGVRDALLHKALSLGVDIRCGSTVQSVSSESGHWKCMDSAGQVHESEQLVVATGGLSYPSLGTDGIGHRIAAQLGHRIVPTYPALTPLAGPHPAGEVLAGLSLPEATLTIKEQNKTLLESKKKGFLFTHKGFSGPSVLDLSHLFSRPRGSSEPELIVNWVSMSAQEWEVVMREEGTRSGLNVTNFLKRLLPNRLAEALTKELNLQATKQSQLTKTQRKELIEGLTQYRYIY